MTAIDQLRKIVESSARGDFYATINVTDWPALLAEVERLNEQVAKMEEVVECATALLDPEGTLNAAGVNPGQEKVDLEAALACFNKETRNGLS